jgi:hypothetical protein
VTHRALLIMVLGFLPACGDSAAVVARLKRTSTPIENDAGTAGVSGIAGVAAEGPAEALWAPYASPEGSSEWTAPVTASDVSFAADSPANSRDGVIFEFSGGKQHDLSKFNEVDLFMEVTEGKSFELFLGRELGTANEVGCSYVFQSGDVGPYTSSLSAPAWCVPTQCGFDLQVTGGFVLADVPDASRLSARITDLKFKLSAGGVGTGSASAMSGARGPLEYCWFVTDWNKVGSANFVGSPTSNMVRVRATRSGDAVTGMAFEVPSSLNLGLHRTMTFDATVSSLDSQSSTSFLVQAVLSNSGRGWTLQGDGNRQTYTVDLTSNYYTFGSAPPSLDEVQRVEFVPSPGGAIDATVYSLKFD